MTLGNEIIVSQNLNRARCDMRSLLDWLGRASSDDCRSWRGLKY
ncbi:hypothetical protein BDD21_1565 [Thiocapsa rosea]|uniref:Uncharacterized protein n=1 Tax=Thiocapsa rosea TaxID=69360 RepID=A0A495V8R1_9GAMM|nr:hypothetical protein BDD21_1565 [Thiocapsa rosea]